MLSTRVARRFQAALSDQLEDKMQRFLANPLDAAEGKEIARWLQANFFFLGIKTPKGQKDLKESVNKLHWFLAHGISQSTDPERLRATIAAEWSAVQRRLADLSKHFSEEGGKSVPKEIKQGGNTYLNVSGFYEDDLMGFVKRLEAVLDMLKGWRKKALSGGVTIALAGPKDFRGTSGGKYKSADDVLYVRATPDVLKRSGGNYGSFEYIIVHELGHRYEYKVHLPSVDFDKPDWWTSRYSRNEGESFAELFALSNFGTTGQGDPAKLDRFEALMAGRDDQPKPEIPEHLKKYRQVQAMKFDSPEALKRYLKEHPGADKSKHSVVKFKAYKQPTEQEIASAKKKAKNTRWKKPDLKEEAVEITRTAEHLGISEKNLLEAFHAAELEDLDEDTWSKLENTDSFDTDTYAKVDAKARKYDRDIAWTLRRMGDTLPASIVLFRKGKAPYLVGGNTRLMASRALGAKPKVLALHV